MWLLRLSFDLSVTAVVLCFDFQGDDICGWDMVCNLYCYWSSCLCIRAYRYSCAYSVKIKVPHFRLGSLLCCWSLEELSLAQLVEGVDVRLDQPFSNPHRGDFNLLIFLFYSCWILLAGLFSLTILRRWWFWFTLPFKCFSIASDINLCYGMKWTIISTL